MAAYPKPEQFEDMVFGNRLAVLSGDFLLANACTGLAQLHNTEVVDMISKVIADMMEGEMMSCCIRATEDLTLNCWKDLVFKCKGSLLASSCKAALKLVSHSEKVILLGLNTSINIIFILISVLGAYLISVFLGWALIKLSPFLVAHFHVYFPSTCPYSTKQRRKTFITL